MKQYAVEILEKHSHGKYGKDRFQVWCLSASSKKNVCDFAFDIVAGMTWREIFADREWSESTMQMHLPFGAKDIDGKIGYEFAERYFSYKAELMK